MELMLDLQNHPSGKRSESAQYALGEQGGNLSTHFYCSLLKILADGMLILPCPVFWLHMDGNWAKILSSLHLPVKGEMLGTGGMNEAWGKGADMQCSPTWRGCSVSTQSQSSQRWLGEEQVSLRREWMVHKRFLVWSSA